MATKIFMEKVAKIAEDLKMQEQKDLDEHYMSGYAIISRVRMHLGFAKNINLAVVGFDTVAQENHLFHICKAYVIGDGGEPTLRVRKSFFQGGHSGDISEISVADNGEEFTIKTCDKFWKTEREEKFQTVHC